MFYYTLSVLSVLTSVIMVISLFVELHLKKTNCICGYLYCSFTVKICSSVKVRDSATYGQHNRCAKHVFLTCVLRLRFHWVMYNKMLSVAWLHLLLCTSCPECWGVRAGVVYYEMLSEAWVLLMLCTVEDSLMFIRGKYATQFLNVVPRWRLLFFVDNVTCT